MTARAAVAAEEVGALIQDVPQEFERGVKLSTLKSWPGNPKRHDVDAIVESIRKNGRYGVVYAQRSSRRLVAGHGRRDAYKVLGVRTADVIWLDIDDDTAARIVAADNRIQERGGYDDDALLKFVQQFDDLAGTGYDEDDVAAMRAQLDNDRDPEPSTKAPPPEDDDERTEEDVRLIEPPKKPASKFGEVYQLGRHRIMCGDSTNTGHVRELLGGLERVDMILTDPPYCSGGFQEAGKRAGSVGTRNTGKESAAEKVPNDTLSSRGYMALMKSVMQEFAGAGLAYVFTDWRMWINLFDVVESSGFGVRNMVVWDKGTPGMGVGWRMQHELIMCGVKVRNPFNNKTALGNVIRAKRTGNIWHPTQKPVELLAKILRVTDKAQTIADPFGGSGSTILAGEETPGRTVYAMELTPRYTDVARQRYADMVNDATLAPRGQLTPATTV